MPGSGTGLDRETKPGEAPCLETQHGWFISKHSLQPLPKPWEEQNTDKLLRWQTRGGSQIRQGSCSLGRVIQQSLGRVQPPLQEPVALRGRGGTWRGAGVAFVLSLRHWGPPLSAAPGSACPWLLPGQCRSSRRPCGAGQGVFSLCPAQALLVGTQGHCAESHSLDVPPGVLSRGAGICCARASQTPSEGCKRELLDS